LRERPPPAYACALTTSLIHLLVIFFLCTQNYSSILTVHPEVIDGRPGTLVIESFVVDVPDGNTKDETCYFVEALLKCNLKSLAEVSERQVIKDQTEPLDR
jgi:abscisic acid receptor (PYR/PYL family)